MNSSHLSLPEYQPLSSQFRKTILGFSFMLHNLEITTSYKTWVVTEFIGLLFSQSYVPYCPVPEIFVFFLFLSHFFFVCSRLILHHLTPSWPDQLSGFLKMLKAILYF